MNLKHDGFCLQEYEAIQAQKELEHRMREVREREQEARKLQEELDRAHRELEENQRALQEVLSTPKVLHVYENEEDDSREHS